MKIPTSPLLFTLALSSSTLAYPTPSTVDSPNPNHENSPLLGGSSGGGEDAWGMRPDQMPGKLGRRWSESTLPVQMCQYADECGGQTSDNSRLHLPGSLPSRSVWRAALPLWPALRPACSVP